MDQGLQGRPGELRRFLAGTPDQRCSQPGLHLAAARRPEAPLGFRRLEDHEYPRGEQAPDTRLSPGLGTVKGDRRMHPTSRREFLKSAAACAGAAGFLVANLAELRANPLGLPIGSQVYPLRSMLKDFPAFAKMMAEIGVTRLELCSPIGYGHDFASLASGSEVRRILADHGMKAESSHFSMGELRNSQQRSIEWANEVGITQMITATLGGGNGGNNPTLDRVKRAADEYNKIAAVAAKADIQQ